MLLEIVINTCLASIHRVTPSERSTSAIVEYCNDISEILHSKVALTGIMGLNLSQNQDKDL